MVVFDKQYLMSPDATDWIRDRARVERIRAYIDTRTAEGKEVVARLERTTLLFAVIPASGLPEVTLGISRYEGMQQIRTLTDILLSRAPECPGAMQARRV